MMHGQKNIKLFNRNLLDPFAWYSSALKLEATHSLWGVGVIYQTTRRHIPEVCILSFQKFK